MALLILGGTADGRHLANYFTDKKIKVIYSVAGLVRKPNVSCDIVSGGFTQFGGLVNYINNHAITAVLDATHPYAKVMSTTAIEAARACSIPCWRFHRSAWQPQTGDDWRFFSEWSEVLIALLNFDSVFFSCGQLTQQQLTDIEKLSCQQKQLLRTAVKPNATLPPTMEWLKAIGPFDYDNELALLRHYEIDCIVSKNSGGDSTVAKLTAARELNIPVYMWQRPELPAADKEFSSYESCQDFVMSALTEN